MDVVEKKKVMLYLDENIVEAIDREAEKTGASRSGFVAAVFKKLLKADRDYAGWFESEVLKGIDELDRGKVISLAEASKKLG